jgi:hypothetical protein
MMRGLNRIVALFLLMALAIVVGATAVAAQGTEPPPLPIIYQGEVFLDGEHVGSGMLSARVGDWTSDFVPVTDGMFRCADPCLLVGPPKAIYVGEKVTFHLEGIEFPATFSFEFPNLSEPRSDTVQLFFETIPSEGTGGTLIAVGIAALVIAVGGGGFLAVKRKR